MWFSRTSRAVVSFSEAHVTDFAQDFASYAAFIKSYLRHQANLDFLEL